MSQLLNQPAPEFTLGVLGGGRLSLGDLRGNMVVLNFWSAECPWSRRADVMLIYRQLAWDRKGIRVLGLACNPDETESEIRHEIASRRIRYPILIDIMHDVVNLYKVETTPQFFVLDVRGAIRYIGGLDDVNATQRTPKKIYLDRAVSALLENRMPDPAITATYGTPIVRPGGPSGSPSQPPPSLITSH